MPYRRIGKTIWHKKGSKWSIKQKASSVENAKSAMNLLHGLEKGWKPSKVTKRKKKK